jgi:pimeloyl-ACP methyl ester carboxylesterase
LAGGCVTDSAERLKGSYSGVLAQRQWSAQGAVEVTAHVPLVILDYIRHYGEGNMLSMCFANKLTVEDRYSMLGYNASVPPYVRQALFYRSFDNDDLLAKLRKPVLITHGIDDPIVKPAVIDQQIARIGHAQIQMMANAGHACFWNDAVRYNRSLRELGHMI